MDRWTAMAGTGQVGPVSNLAFLDIETTGLSGGAGTYAFLVGLGRFEGDDFYLRQVFMRSPAEEQALLLVVADLLQDVDGLVTFNGRSFDLPVLNCRYSLARMQVPWQGKVHFLHKNPVCIP